MPRGVLAATYVFRIYPHISALQMTVLLSACRTSVIACVEANLVKSTSTRACLDRLSATQLSKAADRKGVMEEEQERVAV